MSGLDLTSLRHALTTTFVARSLTVLNTTGSTNADCLRAASQGAKHGHAIIADAQSKGRGRDRLEGVPRSWISPGGLNLYTSVLFRPSFAQERFPGVVLALGIAVADCVETWCEAKPRLKWPNDVLWNDRKLAGILVQTEGSVVVAGIGLNVNACSSDLGKGDLGATSLRLITGRIFDRNRVAAELYLQVEKWYNAYEIDPQKVHAAWIERADIVGKKLTITELDGVRRTLRITGLDENGFLCGRDSTDACVVIKAAERIVELEMS